MERRFYLVDAQVLPEVFLKVVRAKELLASGEARKALIWLVSAPQVPAS